MRDAMKFQYLLLVFGFGYQQLGIDEILFGGAKELSDVFADGSNLPLQQHLYRTRGCSRLC
jgi:hypothetical protein